MSILVVGSVAFDSVETPFGKAEEVLGGSASYFSLAASFFAPVRLVAVVGDDFPEDHLQLFRDFSIDIRGLQQSPGETFRWKGEYGYALNEARTLDTRLNVFESFSPRIPELYRKSDCVFLGNIDPVLQAGVLSQVEKPRFVACDTMNFWIESKPDELRETLQRVEHNLTRAARRIAEWGPKTLVVKKGEYGVAMYHGGSIFGAPAFPLEEVFDPTGAGDSFAGGLVGYLARSGALNDESLRQAVIYGSVMASFNVEDFSLNRLRTLKTSDIRRRFLQFKELTHFEAGISL